MLLILEKNQKRLERLLKLFYLKKIANPYSFLEALLMHTIALIIQI